MKIYSRDVTKEYIQSDNTLERSVFIEAPPEMGLKEYVVLQVIKTLYGIAESGLHWYLTYLDYHTNKLGMFRTTTGPCVLVERTGNKLHGLVILKVDGSRMIRTDAFMDDEAVASKEFK